MIITVKKNNEKDKYKTRISCLPQINNEIVDSLINVTKEGILLETVKISEVNSMAHTS
jgi:hypothetical protein